MRNLLLIAVSILTFSGCQTTGEFLSKTDEVLGEVTDAISSEDTVTGVRSLNFQSEDDIDKQASETISLFLEQAKSDGATVYSEDHPVFLRAKRIYDKVISVSHFANKKGLRLYVVDYEDFNAFAVGGGNFFILKGLMDQTTDDELAYVIGHELAHDAAKHIAEQNAYFTVKSVVARKTEDGYVTTFSNVQEQEADVLGILYSTLAGYDPYASVTIWQKNPTNIAEYAYFRSHPTGDERSIQNKNTANQVVQYWIKGQVNPDFKTILNCNSLYCKKEEGELQPGEGGGILSILELIADTLIKNAQTEQELGYQKQGQVVASNQLPLEPPNVNWVGGYTIYKGTVDRHNERTGLDFGLSNGVGEFFYHFNGNIERGTIQYSSQNEHGYWFQWSDNWGFGWLNLKQYTDGSLRGQIYMNDGTNPGQLLGDWIGYLN